MKEETVAGMHRASAYWVALGFFSSNRVNSRGVMSDEAMAAVLASRDDEVQVLGVFDAANKKEASLELRRLGEAVHFLANALVLGYDGRSAIIFHGVAGAPSLRANNVSNFGRNTARCW